jgi:hypothetical protein
MGKSSSLSERLNHDAPEPWFIREASNRDFPDSRTISLGADRKPFAFAPGAPAHLRRRTPVAGEESRLKGYCVFRHTPLPNGRSTAVDIASGVPTF